MIARFDTLPWRSLLIRCRTVFDATKTDVGALIAPVQEHLTRHRRKVAVAVSLGLHLLFLLLILPAKPTGGFASGGAVSGEGMGAGEGMVVTLIDAQQDAERPLKAKETVAQDDTITPLTDQTLTTPQALAVQLSDLSVPTLDTVPQLTPESASTPAAAAADNMGATGTSGLTQGAGDDLWAAIAPCWNRVVNPSTVEVVLEVSFTADGHLAKPPVIERPADATADPARLGSETSAIQALVQCGAYPMAGGQDHVAIRFLRP